MSDAKKSVPSTAKMPFDQAKKFVLTFGKFKHLPSTERTLDRIASTNAGLAYLDWLRGSLHERCLSWQTYTRDALDAYLSDPTIARELNKVGTTFGQDARARDCGY